jgi:hypothetical protein
MPKRDALSDEALSLLPKVPTLSMVVYFACNADHHGIIELEDAASRLVTRRRT